ncbi:hypothetical protein EGW08_014440 [Elysia chlorotica]|uniref:Reverse transcriptase domain-containing protein n=1 Tax=Elysia chlorotica TaxID=188477 RepID=A0A3S1BD05_ELYCH|nr:hypothetical protein EGW08_014440 [Elysia chlorotica]
MTTLQNGRATRWCSANDLRRTDVNGGPLQPTFARRRHPDDDDDNQRKNCVSMLGRGGSEVEHRLPTQKVWVRALAIALYWLGRCHFDATDRDRSYDIPVLSRVWQHIKLSDVSPGVRPQYSLVSDLKPTQLNPEGERVMPVYRTTSTFTHGPENRDGFDPAAITFDAEQTQPSKDRAEIERAIKSFKSGKAPGQDNLNAELFKLDPAMSAEIIKPLFTNIWDKKNCQRTGQKASL